SIPWRISEMLEAMVPILTSTIGLGQPLLVGGPGIVGHSSIESGTPSLSASNGQPAPSTFIPSGVSGHLSYKLQTPSLSSSAHGIFASAGTALIEVKGSCH